MKTIVVAAVLMWLTMPGCVADTVVLNFDGAANGSGSYRYLSGNAYGGLYWGSPSSYGRWAAWDYFHSTYVMNMNTTNLLWFEFPEPVTFTGADFARFPMSAGPEEDAKQVRFLDDQGNASEWLDIGSSWTFLAADFTNSRRIYVERTGGNWFAMDNLTYTTTNAVPEPSSALLALSAVVPALGIAGARRRRA